MTGAESVNAYLDSLEPDRRALIDSIRETILANLDDGFEEIVDFGMIVYAVPLERYPDTYNGRPLMYAALASQKRHVSVYLMSIYSDDATAEWFHEKYEETGKRLDMGKSCVRFRKESDVPFELIGEAVARDTPDSFIERFERVRSTR